MKLKRKILSQLSLFTSVGTLVCCALPSLFVVLGLGVAVSGLISVFPQVIWLSENKLLVFGISGALIALNLLLHFKTRPPQTCDIIMTDGSKTFESSGESSQLNTSKLQFTGGKEVVSTACEDSKDLSYWMLLLSCVIWLFGAFFAFFIKYFI